MKRILMIIFAISLFHPISSYSFEDFLSYGAFGKVALYRQSSVPAHVVLFVSGDGGWNLGVVDMARELATLDALVVGIDMVHYVRSLDASSEKCSYPATDFEALSQFVQKKLNFPHYITPVLIGYSSGATLVYATLVQSPPNTFAGAVSMGFCPDLLLKKPMCKGNGLEWKPGPKGKGYSFLPAMNLEAGWIALQGNIDEVCDANATSQYVHEVSNGELVLLPKVGHGFSVSRNWMPQFREAFAKLSHTPEDESPMSRPAGSVVPKERYADAVDVKDLPLVELPATGNSSDLLAVILSGDGGWANIDRQIGKYLATRGVGVIGFNSLQYFWTKRTPDIAAKDLERVLRYYLTAWKKDKAILIGYSLGADVLPFMADRLPPQLLDKVISISLLGPGETAEFEFHLTDWLRNEPKSGAHPVLPEVEKLKGKKLLCFFGEDERDSLCRKLNANESVVIRLTGGHHFGGGYQAIAERILKEAK